MRSRLRVVLALRPAGTVLVRVLEIEGIEYECEYENLRHMKISKSPDETSHSGRENLTVLVVDDNPVGCMLLKKLLRKEGYQVLTAHDGPTGREIAVAARPDLIILDVIMPGEDGFQVMRSLKKNPRTASIPVIFLTGKDDLDAKLAGFELGAVDYVTKPFQGPEVLARVRLHLKLSLATNSLIASQASKLKQLEEAQISMLVTPGELPGGRFGVCYEALLEAGGDFYDAFEISNDVYGYFVADVSGHDIATSYLTAAIKALLKQNCSPVYKPVESMRMINDVLVEILSEGVYLTACYVKLNRNSKVMSVVNAGHPPVIYLPRVGAGRLVETEGDILGMFNEVYYEERNFKVTPGDRFFLYSDGLVERAGEKKVWPQCLAELLDACGHVKDAPIREAAGLLKELMIDKEVRPDDDIVVLGVEI